MAIYVILARDNDGNPLGGQTPSFNMFIDVTSGSGISAPSIDGLSGGFYKFDYAPSGDVAFIVDVAPSGLDGDRRYIVGTIGPSDSYLDAAITSRATPADVNINLATD